MTALLPPPPAGSAAGPAAALPPAGPPDGEQHAAAVPPLADWHLRVAAALVDGLLLLALTVQVYGLAALALGASGGLALAVLAVGFAALLAVSVQQRVQLGRSGATIGKRLLGLRVVSLRDGLPIGVLNAVLRPLAHVPDGLLSLGYLLPLVDRRRQTLADKMQRTVVLRVRPEGPRVGLLPLLATAQSLVLVLGVSTLAVLVVEEESGATVLEQAAPLPTADVVPQVQPPAGVPDPAPLDPADLLGRIVPPAPGNELLEESPALSLLEAAERLTGAEGEDAAVEADALRASGLVGAAARSYVTPEDDFYEVLVVRYDSPGSARAALDDLQQFNGDAAPSSTVPDARVYGFEDGAESLALGDLAVGPYLYEVSAGATSLPTSLELLEAVLAAQARHAATTS